MYIPFRIVITFYTVSILIHYVEGLDLISEKCLDCLGFSDYNNNTCELHDTISMLSDGETPNKVCGVYKITRNYFVDCKRYIPAQMLSEFGDYEACALDYNCARACVNGYMKKYRSHCNDGVDLTCAHFGRLHSAGPNGCLKSNLRNSETWLKNMTDYCGCLAIYENKTFCNEIQKPTTMTLSPKFLATVIAVPIVSFLVLVTVIVTIVLCCIIKKSNRNDRGSTSTSKFSGLENSSYSNGLKTPKQQDFDAEIPPSLKRYASAKFTQPSAAERPPTVTFTAQDGSVSTLDLRDIVISPKTKPNIIEQSVYEPALSYNSDLDEDENPAAGVYAQKVYTKKPPKSHHYINFDNIQDSEKETVTYENSIFDDDDKLNKPKDVHQLGTSCVRAPIPVPRSTPPKKDKTDSKRVRQS